MNEEVSFDSDREKREDPFGRGTGMVAEMDSTGGDGREDQRE